MTWIYDLIFFHFLKVSTLEWWEKGRHLKKSSVNPAGLEPKTIGIDAPCLLHEMCWCHQRGFFIGLHKTCLGRNGILLRDHHLFEHNSLFVAIWVEAASGNTWNLERERGSNNMQNLNIIINSNNSSGCGGSSSSSSSSD